MRNKNCLFPQVYTYFFLRAIIADQHNKSEHIRELEEKLQFIIDEKIKVKEFLNKMKFQFNYKTV